MSFFEQMDSVDKTTRAGRGAYAAVRRALLWVAAIFCLNLAGLGTGTAWGASFTASLDRDTIATGETATLSLTFDGGESKNVPVPDVPGLQFTQSGTAQSVNIVNGAMSSTVTVTFSVTPQKEGEFVIPALTADVNGQRLASRPLKLVVQKANAPSTAQVNSGSEVAFMRLSLPKQQVYVGEVVVAQLQIFLRDDVQNYGNPSFTATPADGFIMGKNAGAGQFRTQVGNRVYTVLPISLALTVLKAGDLTLGPFSAVMTVVLPSSNQQGDPFFRMFNSGEQKQVSLTAEEVHVHSIPLPDENKPANFSGAIGQYTMAVTAGPTNVAVGDPITVRIQISGHGALDSLTLPAQPEWNNFKVYPPTSKLETSDRLGLDGAKTFEEIVSPDNTGVHELPPFSFSYFDPEAGAYRTLTQPAEPLIVRATGMAPAPTVAGTPGAQPPPTPQDILPIKQATGALASVGPPLVTRPAFLVLQSLPVLAWLAAFVWRRRADNLANNPRLRRHRAVAQLIASGVDDLKKYAAANQPDEFFATLFRLLQEQLGERLDCPASSITEAVIDERLAALDVPAATLDSLRQLFQLCNQARYAPVHGSAELNSVTAQFEKVIGDLQELKT
jgi:hypothetical protein